MTIILYFHVIIVQQLKHNNNITHLHFMTLWICVPRGFHLLKHLALRSSSPKGHWAAMYRHLSESTKHQVTTEGQSPCSSWAFSVSVTPTGIQFIAHFAGRVPACLSVSCKLESILSATISWSSLWSVRFSTSQFVTWSVHATPQILT